MIAIVCFIYGFFFLFVLVYLWPYEDKVTLFIKFKCISIIEKIFDSILSLYIIFHKEKETHASEKMFKKVMFYFDY